MSTLRDIISDINNQASETYKYTNNLFKFTVDGRPGGIYALTGITLLTIGGMIMYSKDNEEKNTSLMGSLPFFGNENKEQSQEENQEAPQENEESQQEENQEASQKNEESQQEENQEAPQENEEPQQEENEESTQETTESESQEEDKKEQYGGKTRKRKSKMRKNKMQTRSRRH